jgi:hypothetical protein
VTAREGLPAQPGVAASVRLASGPAWAELGASTFSPWVFEAHDATLAAWRAAVRAGGRLRNPRAEVRLGLGGAIHLLRLQSADEDRLSPDLGV